MKTFSSLILFTYFLPALLAYEKPDDLYFYIAKLDRVIDGDTIVVDVDLGFRTWVHGETLRLAGINTPEPRGSTKSAGDAATAFLEEKLRRHEAILIRTEKDKQGKFGRWIAEVYVWNSLNKRWESANQMLLNAGHAVPYDGS